MKDPEIERLSTEQKNLRNKINAERDKEERIELRKKRREKLRKIKKIKNMKEQEDIIKIVEEVEKQKDDSRKMFEVIRQLQNREPKKPLLVENKDKTGLIANEAEQIEKITKYLKDFFNKENAETVQNITPTEMVNKFTAKEVKDAIKSLKNNKSPGIDELRAEQLKYGPEEVHNEIAELLNEIAKTGEHQERSRWGY